MIVSTVERATPQKKKRHIGLFVFIAIVILLLAGLGFTVFKIFGFTSTVFKSAGIAGDIASLLPSNVSDVQKSLNEGKTVNILLLGYGGAGHDGAYLSDSMMVVSVNPVQKNVAFISIPRDMWVKIPSSASYNSYGKINSAYEIGVDDVNYQDRLDKYKGKYGGGNIAKDVVSNTLGIPIDYFVSLDFDGFKTIIDDLGGVDVNVDNAFDDYYYPSGDSNVNGGNCSAPMNTPTTCKYWHIHFNPGLQHMSGQVALEYARSRHAEGVEGTDFARSQRQQKVILAVKDKATKINALPQLFNIMNSLQSSLLTDLTVADIKDLVNFEKGINTANIVKDGLTDQNVLTSSYSSDGQYILIPKKGIDDYSGVYTYINQIWLRHSITSEANSATVEVLNGTIIPLLAASANQTLTDLGLQSIVSTRRLPNAYTTSVIYDYSNGKYPNTVSALKQEIGGTVQVGTPDMNPDNVTFVVVLGNDYQNK